MISTHAVLIVSMAALAACSHDQPAASSPTTAAVGRNMGVTEQMPPDTSSSGNPTAPSTTAAGAMNEAPILGKPPNVTPTSTVPPLPSWTDGQILDVIHTADVGGIEQARLASTRSRDGRVMQFAAMMLKDHTEADGKAQSVATRLATTFQGSQDSRSLDDSAHATTEALRRQAAADFDRAYLEAQVEELQAVLASIDNDLMPHAQAREVKDLLTAVRGRVMRHLQHAQDLAAAMLK